MHEVSILPNTQRDDEAAKQRKLYLLMRTIPDAKLKKTSTEERGELFRLPLRVARADYPRVLSILTPSLDRAAHLQSNLMLR